MRIIDALRPDRPAVPHPVLFACGIAAVLGAVAGLSGDIITVRLNDQLNFVANTVSQGAAGPHSIWVDLGLTLEGLGLVAIAAGLHHWSLGRNPRFIAGCAVMALTGLSVVLLAWHNAYGDGEPGGFVFHKPLTLVIGLLFAAALGLLARELGELDTGYYRFSFIAAGAWLIAWPAFIVTPEAYNGAVERIAGFTLITWMVIAGRLLMRRGRGERLDEGGF
ncbi:MAG: DUF998 domain-containing protein [Oceanicaulis sp.]